MLTIPSVVMIERTVDGQTVLVLLEHIYAFLYLAVSSSGQCLVAHGALVLFWSFTYMGRQFLLILEWDDIAGGSHRPVHKSGIVECVCVMGHLGTRL